MTKKKIKYPKSLIIIFTILLNTQNSFSMKRLRYVLIPYEKTVIRTIEYGNIENLKWYLDKESNLAQSEGCSTDNWINRIITAVEWNNQQALKLLLPTIDQHKHGILNIIKNDNIKVFKILVSPGLIHYDEQFSFYSINTRSEEGPFSLLSLAIIFKAKKIIEHIIKNKKFNINTYFTKRIINNNYDTVEFNNLALAIMLGNTEIINLLLSQENISIKEAYFCLNENPWAEKHLKQEIISLLKEMAIKNNYNKVKRNSGILDIKTNNITNNIFDLPIESKTYDNKKNPFLDNFGSIIQCEPEFNNIELDDLNEENLLAKKFLTLIKSKNK